MDAVPTLWSSTTYRRQGSARLYAHWNRVCLWTVCWLYRLATKITRGCLPPIVGASCVVQHDGRILAIDRSDGLGYSLPGGVIKSDETVEQALLREVREETGFEVEIRGLVGVYSGPDRDPRFSSVSIVYSAEIVGGVEQDSREGAVRWLDLYDLPLGMAFDSHVVRDLVGDPDDTSLRV